MPEAATVDVGDGVHVDALLDAPPHPRALLVLAHGAGAGMTHPFMAALAAGLAQRGLAVWRYQFPFMQAGRRRPDPPALAQAAVRAAVAQAARRLPGVALFAGGKSYGGRMTSQAQAASPLAGVRGLAFVGFPLHPAGRPGIERAQHLQGVTLPMLFVQGTADKLADPALLRPVLERLGGRATLHAIDGADHAFHVPVRSGRTDTEVLDDAAGTLATWLLRHAG